MQIILNENQTKEMKNISYLEIDDRIVYYKEIVHPLEFIKLYQDEKPTGTPEEKIASISNKIKIVWKDLMRQIGEEIDNTVQG